MREIILNTLSDTISDFLYYDRREDEDLPVGTIELAIIGGVVSVDEMVTLFRKELLKIREKGV